MTDPDFEQRLKYEDEVYHGPSFTPEEQRERFANAQERARGGGE